MGTRDQRLAWMIILAAVLVGLVGPGRRASVPVETDQSVARRRGRRVVSRVGHVQAVLIGSERILLADISRSVTMSAGMLRGPVRDDAARFASCLLPAVWKEHTDHSNGTTLRSA